MPLQVTGRCIRLMNTTVLISQAAVKVQPAAEMKVYQAAVKIQQQAVV